MISQQYVEGVIVVGLNKEEQYHKSLGLEYLHISSLLWTNPATEKCKQTGWFRYQS